MFLKLLLQFPFCLIRCIGTSYVGSFTNNVVHLSHKLLYNLRQFLASEAVYTEVACMEYTYSINFYPKGVRIKSRVVNCYRHYGEWTKSELFPCLECVGMLQPFWHFLMNTIYWFKMIWQNQLNLTPNLAYINGKFLGQFCDTADVVTMIVRNEQCTLRYITMC